MVKKARLSPLFWCQIKSVLTFRISLLNRKIKFNFFGSKVHHLWCFAFLWMMFCCCLNKVTAQNIGISANSSFVPDASAGLDVNFTNKGLLIPRVALSSADASTPINSPAISLLIYNTATAGIGQNAVLPGYYYWSGSIWLALSTVNSNWSLRGNSGSLPTFKFLGTTDNASLYFRTYNINRFLLDSLGSGAIGSNPIFTTGLAHEKFLVDAGSTSTNQTPVGAFNLIAGKGYLDNYVQLNIQNNAPTANASSDIVASNNQATETTNFVDMGINSTGNAATGIVGGAGNAYVYAIGNDFTIGNGTAGKNLIFFTGGIDNNEKMRITSAGNIGIGVTNPGFKLTVAGTIAPSVDNTYNLGSSNMRWNLIYTSNLIQVSDRRLKTDIKPLKYGLKEVLNLQPVTYKFKKDLNTTNIGLIAQDVKLITPEAVIGNEAKETLGISYQELIPVLINAVKEQQMQISKLNEQVKALLEVIHIKQVEH